MTFLLIMLMLVGVTACGNKKEEDVVQAENTSEEEGDADYDVEEDLVDGVLTEEMLDEMEEATTEEEKKDEKDKTSSQKKYYIKVNRQTNVVTVYTCDKDGAYTQPVKAFVCSTGKNNGTPKGKFTLSSKHRWQLMNGGVYSQYASRITGHILFHSVPYRQQKNNTLCSNYYNQLGRQASAGCVRLTCADAQWIYSNCASGTVVEIFDGSSASDPLGKPGSVTVPTSGTYSKWDPTDPDSNNPWKKIATVAPVISGAKSYTVELGSGNLNLTAGVTATDACGLTLSVSASGNVDTTKAGTYSITYSATDSRGNHAQTSVAITVKDTTAPSISCSADGQEYTGTRGKDEIYQYIKKNTTLKDASGTASVTDITVSIDENNGVITGTITAKDSAGNTATKAYTMTFEPDGMTGPEGGSSEETTESTTTTEESTETDAAGQKSGSTSE